MKTDFSFTLDTSGELPRLSVAGGRGKGKVPDYRSYSGAARRALREFSLLLEKQSRSFFWDLEIEEGERALYDPGGRMIAIAAASGLLRNGSGKALVPQADTSRVMVSVTPAEDGSFTLRPELPESRESGNGNTGGTDEAAGEGEAAGAAKSAAVGGELKAVAPDYVLAGNRLFPCEDLGAHWQEVAAIGRKVGRQELPLYLSLILSRLPGLGINYPGFRTVTTAPRTAVPGLLFQEIDAYGFLHVLPVSTLPGEI